VLNRLFAHALEQVPDDFGVLLTTETVESGLAQTVTGRAAWVAEHSKEIAREMAGKR
jgi:hypothetical protein